MALDQLVHAEAQRLWSEFRAAWAKEGKKLKLARALLAIRWVTHDAYSKANVISSWRHCGFEGGQPVNRTKLLVDRCDEIFKSTPGKDGVDFKSGESKWLIPAPKNWQKASTSITTKCLKCKRVLVSEFRNCPGFGEGCF